MDECNERAEAATTLEEFERWDAALHEAIAAAAHNSFVAGVFRLMNEARAQGEWGVLKRRSATPERRLAYQQRAPRAGRRAEASATPSAARALCLCAPAARAHQHARLLTHCSCAGAPVGRIDRRSVRGYSAVACANQTN